jgi:hypothetical protein
MAVQTQFQFRRGTASQWTSTNPTLAAGELGYETDTGKFKIGTGSAAWTSLSYASGGNQFDTSIVFEGATSNNFETTLAVTDPTADRTITFPDASGTVALTETSVSFNDITATGNLSVAGNITVSGTTTSINTTNLEVEDKNILLAKVGPLTISASGTIASFTSEDGNYSITITGLSSTTGVVAGMNVTATNGTGGFGTSANSITATSIPSGTSIVVTQLGGTVPTVGTITNIILSASDATADGAGLTVQGTVNKTFNWVDSTDSWTSSENINLLSGKNFKIDGNNVLTSSQVLGKSVPSGDIVGISDTQTLTNKTLTSPKINEDVAVTATATELNVLDGITSTTAELNILDGVTSTAAELNILDGVTATATELNYVDGVTSAIQTQINDKSPIDSPTFTTKVNVNTNNLNVGSQSEGLRTTDDYTNPIAVFSIDADDDYAQLLVKNTGNGVNSSTDIIAYSDNGDDTSGWIDMGITSSAFADAGFTITGKNDGYMFLEAPIGNIKSINNKALTDNVATLTTSAAHEYSVGDEVVVSGVDATFNGTYTISAVTSTTFSYSKTATNVTSAAVSPVGSAKVATGNGNLVLATGGNGTRNKIVFAAGGLSSDNAQMEITPDVNVHIEIPTPSTSPTTGALTIVGGVGIQGDLNIQGDVAIEGTIVFGGAGTTVETSNLSVTDPLIFVGDNNAADIIDLGFVGEYTTGGNTKYSGIVRDASDGVIKAFKDATTKPTSTVNFAEAGLGYSDLQVAGLTASSASIGDVSNTELQYLNGVTSAVQTQLNAKIDSSTVSTTYAPIANPVFTGKVSVPTSIEFEGTTANEFETTLTVTDATADRTITLPDATGTVSLVTNTETLTNKSLTAAALTGTTKIQQILEKATVSATAATGTINYDLLTNGSVTYYTSNASANWTLNLRGNGSTTLNNVMATGEALTIAFLVTQSTAYYATALQVDGNAITPKWQDGTAPSSGNASSIDIYTYTVIKTGNANFTAFASRTKFA